jgi:hypothetical protein
VSKPMKIENLISVLCDSILMVFMCFHIV